MSPSWMVRVRVVSCCVFTLALTAGTHASAREPKSTSASDVQQYNFEAESVSGDLRHPDGEILHARPRQTGRSLVRARRDFLVALYKAVEDL